MKLREIRRAFVRVLKPRSTEQENASFAKLASRSGVRLTTEGLRAAGEHPLELRVSKTKVSRAAFFNAVARTLEMHRLDVVKGNFVRINFDRVRALRSAFMHFPGRIL